MIPLEVQLKEAGRFYVCGVIENGPNGPQRWAEVIEAVSARQAEDLAREQVQTMVADSRHGNLWVAGVYQLNVTDADGNLGDPAFLSVDTYAKYVDPDQTDEL